MTISEKHYQEILKRQKSLKNKNAKPKKPSYSKYRNTRITVDGINYDSITEYERHMDLKLLEKAGLISDLRYHDKRDIIVLGKNPRITYIPDFYYVDEDGVPTVEDIKGMQTKEFIVKKKIFLNLINDGTYDLRFKIVKKQRGSFVTTEKYEKDFSFVKK